mmetsp:Transcript_20004/g.52378  ORF Transcript_20004/g.52378 Transcript_20004/m.52378 type:complete len:234 (-) Transcript_20004:377-1078(-)
MLHVVAGLAALVVAHLAVERPVALPLDVLQRFPVEVLSVGLTSNGLFPAELPISHLLRSFADICIRGLGLRVRIRRYPLRLSPHPVPRATPTVSITIRHHLGSAAVLMCHRPGRRLPSLAVRVPIFADRTNANPRHALRPPPQPIATSAPPISATVAHHLSAAPVRVRCGARRWLPVQFLRKSAADIAAAATIATAAVSATAVAVAAATFSAADTHAVATDSGTTGASGRTDP